MKLAIHGGEKIKKNRFPRWPQVDNRDEELMLDVVRSGNWWMYSYGKDELAETSKGYSRVMAAEEAFARMQHVKHALATTSGSASLEIACRAIGLKPGDEVITTPYTFIATSTCILNAGAIPVFADIEPHTYNLNPELIEGAITDRTRAIFPVHFGGFICDMDRINAIAKRHGLKVVEDAAHAHGASLSGGRFAGSLGDMAIFSFQQSKVLTCGEGGMITAQNDELAELAWSLRHYGRTKTGKWYEHFRLGWHYRMSEMQGALLLSQMEKLETQNAVRRRNAAWLQKSFASLPGLNPIEKHPETENDIYYVWCLRYDPKAWDGISKEKVVAALVAEGIPVFGGYTFPLYANPLFANIDFNGKESLYRLGGRGPVGDFRAYCDKCPVVERACSTESIWITGDMLLGTEEDTRDIFRGFSKVYENRKELIGK